MTTQTLDPAIVEYSLSPFFEIREMGISICPGTNPPTQAFEALIYHLCGLSDNVRWQIAAACNLYQRYHRKEAHIMAASRLDVSPETVSHWCYIERKIPYNARVDGLSIWFHKLVATVKDSALQREYLETCKANAWSESSFENWLKKQSVEIPEHHYQSDRKFQREEEEHKAITENAILKKENEELKEEVKKHRSKSETSQVSQPPAESPLLTPPSNSEGRPATGPDLTDLDWNGLLQVKDTLIDAGYTAVTIHANGDITWHK